MARHAVAYHREVDTVILQQTERELSHSDVLKGLRAHLQALSGDDHRYDSLLALIGDARFALLGEAPHGTQEFYSAAEHTSGAQCRGVLPHDVPGAGAFSIRPSGLSLA